MNLMITSIYESINRIYYFINEQIIEYVRFEKQFLGFAQTHRGIFPRTPFTLAGGQVPERRGSGTASRVGEWETLIKPYGYSTSFRPYRVTAYVFCSGVIESASKINDLK